MNDHDSQTHPYDIVAVRQAAAGRHNAGGPAEVMPLRWHAPRQALLAVLAVVASACTTPHATGTDRADMPVALNG